MAKRKGQACTLPGAAWTAWCEHLLKTSPTWMYVLTVLCHMFCLRVTEGLMLRACDFNWKSRTVRVSALKRAPEVHKRMMTAYMAKLQSLRKHGKSRRRSRECGARGKRSFIDKWVWPKGSSYLFPNRKGNDHIKKDVVCHNISKAKKTFSPPASCRIQDVQLVRSHSARHRKINDLKNSGVAPDAGMTFARIKHKKTWDLYGKLDQTQAGDALQRNKKLQKTLKALYSK